MKRIVFALVVVVIAAGAGIYLLRRGAGGEAEVATWLPGGTVLFEDMPDIHRSRDRWPGTALAQMIDEPEVQAFLQRPMGLVPGRAELDRRVAELREIDPERFFAAVTEWGGTGGPRTLVGLKYGGDKEGVDSLVDEVRKWAREEWPAGKSDIEKYGAGEIETFTTPGFSAGLAYRGQWVFLATDTAVLKGLLDRYEGKTGTDSLAELPAFKTCLGHLPEGLDNVLFLRPALLADKMESLALMVNPTADAGGMDRLKKIEAASMAMKMDGAVMRDAAYIMKPGVAEETALAMDAMKLSSSATIVATCERMEALGDVQWPDRRSDPSGVLQLLGSYVKAFTDQGLGGAQLEQAFGPESGFVMDWPQGAVIPTPLLMADVRDGALARKFLDTLPALTIAAGVEFTHTEDGGIAFYSLPPTGIGFFPLQVTMGLTGKGVIGALSMEAVREASKRWDAGKAGLENTDGYKAAAALVQEPTLSFTYVETKAIFERIYGMFRGVATMGLVPHLADYVDIGKLPAPETISRHLSPLVASGAVRDGGVLVESAGPVTATQAALITVGVAGAAMVPLLEQQMKGQSVTIPRFPGFGTGGGNPFGSPLNQGGSPKGGAPGAGGPAAMASPSVGGS